jgi:hypothetical protein
MRAEGEQGWRWEAGDCRSAGVPRHGGSEAGQLCWGRRLARAPEDVEQCRKRWAMVGIKLQVRAW